MVSLILYYTLDYWQDPKNDLKNDFQQYQNQGREMTDDQWSAKKFEVEEQLGLRFTRFR